MIVHCHHCKADVDAEELHTHKFTEPYEYSPGQFAEIPREYTLLKCRICSNPILTCIDEDQGESVVVYPPPERISYLVPGIIRVAVEEAKACNSVRAYTATAIMCRKAVEGICDSLGIKNGDLQDRLAVMKNQGMIDAQLHEWADTLRSVGNEAAHGVRVTVSADDARDVLSFTIALSEYLFAFKKRFDEFKKRREERAKKRALPRPVPLPPPKVPPS